MAADMLGYLFESGAECSCSLAFTYHKPYKQPFIVLQQL